jgi:mannosyltransferase OCH1-like enzyme
VLKYDNIEDTKEVLYCHMQKRKLDILFKSYTSGFYINENSFSNTLLENCIPLKIWQTWEIKDLPPKMKECVDKLKTLHPTFDYHLFDDNDRRVFIENYFPKEVLLAYDSLIPGAYKADLWRLCILYIHGGVYMDIRLQFCNGFSLYNFMDKEYFGYDGSYMENNKSRISICNGLLISKKNNCILLKGIIHIVFNIIKNFYGNTPYCITGPRLIGHIVETSILRPDLSLTHHGPIGNQKIKLNNDIVIDFYKEYNNERAQLSKLHYTDAWKQKLVYSNYQEHILDIYNTKKWSQAFIELLNLVDCNNIDEITKYSGATLQKYK